MYERPGLGRGIPASSGSRTARIGLVLAAALCVGACSSGPAPAPDEALADAPRRERPSPYRLSVAPLEVAPIAAQGPVLPGEVWRPVATGVADLENALVFAVQHSRAFQSARTFAARPVDPSDPAIATDADDDARDAGAFAGAATPASSLDQRPPPLGYPLAPSLSKARELAQRQGDDLVLRMRLTRHAVRFRGVNGHIVTFALLFVNLWLPAYWVGCERFSGELELEAELIRARDGARVWRRSYEARSDVALDTWDRGFHILGSFYVPGALDAESYEMAGEIALGYAYNELARSLCEDLASLELDAGPRGSGAPPAGGRPR